MPAICVSPRSCYHVRMDTPGAPDAIKILIEVDEDGLFKIQSAPPDGDALIAALELALFAVKTKVDNERCLH